MRTSLVLLAGAMMASAAVAATSDPQAEERYRMKYGRNTPTEEARREARAAVETTGALHKEDPLCCHALHGNVTLAMNDPGYRDRFQAKYGRNTPREEARQRAAETELAQHVRKCLELGHCMRRSVETAAAPALAASDQEQRVRAKYGRSPSQRKTLEQEELLAASSQWIGCEQPCCTHGE